MIKKQLSGKDAPVPVIDLFAGPGGLGEGFSRAGKEELFRIALSVEMDKYAHETLLMRAVQRKFPLGRRIFPQILERLAGGEFDPRNMTEEFAIAFSEAKDEAICRTLGQDNNEIHSRIERALGDKVKDGKWVLIGGPPCQAYSLAGRARKSRDKRNGTYVPEDDHRHYLYSEYLNILARYKPAVFVMENVKGLLSAKINGHSMFDNIVNDLRHPAKAWGSEGGIEYELYSIGRKSQSRDSSTQSAKSFIVESELFGVPQKRHRVIIVGIRTDFFRNPHFLQLHDTAPLTCGEAIGDLPRIRSRLSRESDNFNAWSKVVMNIDWRKTLELPRCGRPPLGLGSFLSRIKEIESGMSRSDATELGRGLHHQKRVSPAPARPFPSWYNQENSPLVFNHEARSHMGSDLHRYLFSAVMAEINGESPKLPNFPKLLLPKHRNAEISVKTNRLFADRFRVQVAGQPSTTITSHISKDGHGFIHFDPSQCRTLTVREAARLQTFPDDYCFLGPRTAQYHQVGNAVPPYLAFQIAEAIGRAMGMI